jgi:hypothetical protein
LAKKRRPYFEFETDPIQTSLEEFFQNAGQLLGAIKHLSPTDEVELNFEI